MKTNKPNLVEHFTKELNQDQKGNSISIIWTKDDVITKANDDGIVLTDSQARDILLQVEHYHDASIGINWDVIGCHIDGYLNK